MLCYVILMNKTDLDAAFRRLHVILRYALLCTTIIGSIAYILFRLPFGSSPAPCNFCLISEFIINLAQHIVCDETWNPTELHNPNQHRIPGRETTHNDNVPFGKARPIIVNIETQPIYIDGFVDDLVTICLDMEKYIKRAMNGVPLAIHCVFRPKDEDEPISRDDILCLRKLLGEGALSEIKLILGWIIDSRLFKVFLSEDKERHWQKDIDELIADSKNNK